MLALKCMNCKIFIILEERYECDSFKGYKACRSYK